MKNLLDCIGNDIFCIQQSESDAIDFGREIEYFEYKPLISVIMPLYNAPVKYLEIALNSLINQKYSNWELCAVDDGSIDKRAVALITEFASKDERIKLVISEKNGGISYASNKALEVARGEFIALMDQDDEITTDALYWIVKSINEHKNVEWIYTDECKVGLDSRSEKTEFFFKPDWSPELLINCMYTGHFTVYRRDVVEKVGGFRSEYDFSQDYDLALRIAEVTNNIVHIERVLYFWRMLPTSGAAGGKDFARISNLKALGDSFYRKGLKGIPQKNGLANYFSVTKEDVPLISIIIPSDSISNLQICIDKILAISSYKNIEIIPVTNSKVAKDIEECYEYINGIINVCYYDKLYNFSDKCNEGAKIAKGSYLIFYNDDVIPYSVDWIQELLNVMEIDGVGGVSPLLLHEDLTVQYAGMITGVPGLYGTSFNGRMFGVLDNPVFHYLLIRDVSILSGACMMIRKEIFNEISGFNALNTPNGHSDIDISFKIRNMGLRCVYTPYASLIHIGNHSWRLSDKQDKADLFCIKYWGEYTKKDPYFTDSMKKMFYHDFPYDYNLNIPNELINKESKKDILFITHELNCSGAPLVLMEMVKCVHEMGYFPVVLSYKDGELKEEYLKLGITVIVAGKSYFESDLFQEFANNFDLVIANTLAVSKAVQKICNIIPNVMWWLHEGEEALRIFKEELPQQIMPKVHMLAAGEYTREVVSSHLIGKINLLNIGIPEIESLDTTLKIDSNKFIMAVVGTVEKRKGQDILLEAILKLKDSIRSRVKIIMIGNEADITYCNNLKDISLKNSLDVEMIGNINRDKVINYIKNVDCVVVPSIDEPTSMVAVESFMKGKACLCSDKTGISKYITHGENGFVFESGNTDKLAQIIEEIVDMDEGNLSRIGFQGRNIYEGNFDIKTFKNNCIEIIKELIL